MPQKRSAAVQPEQFTTFGQLLRYLRQRAGLTQRELSIAVGYSESQISRLEKNQRAPDAAILAARFVPALHLKHEREWAGRLLELARTVPAGEPAAENSQPAAENSRPAAEKPRPAAAPRPLPAHNLPTQLTNFIGRTADLAAVEHQLAEARLVTLTGAGGCGKTRLALQAASAHLADYPDGVWWVELAPLTEARLVAPILAAVLGLREEAGRPLLTTLTDFLSARQTLIILDNCEHLIEACASLAESLLGAGPGLRLLATSREALGAAGERQYPVPPLPGPDPAALPPLRQLAQFDAVRLFVERAGAAQPHFGLTPQNAAAVAQICQRLDGIPLALELAATRVKALTVEQIAARLDDSFAVLTGGSRTALPRQQTLRATMDWSHALLTEPERRLFRRLAVFSGSWSLEAAEAVGAGPDLAPAAVLETLARLIDKSLIQAEETNGAMRYSRLETVRQYAREKLVEAGEAEHCLDRHLQFYLRRVEQAEPWLDAGPQTEWFARLEADQDNLRAALEWACLRHPEIARWLAGLLRWFWISGDQLTEARARYAQTLQAAELSPATLGTAFALQGAGMAAAFLFLFSEALPALEQSAAAWRVLDNPPRLAECLWVLGYSYANLGQDARASALFAENEPLFRAVGTPQLLASALGHWSMALVKRRPEDAAAQALLAEALALAQAARNPMLLGSIYMNLGYLEMQRGNYEIAGRHYQEALTWRRAAGTRWLVATSLQHMTDALYMQGAYQVAQPYCEEALALTQALGDRLSEAAVLLRLGLLAADTRQYPAALARFAACLEIARARFYPPVLAHLLVGYAQLWRRQGDFPRAVRLLACVDLFTRFTQQPLLPLGRFVYEGALTAAKTQLPEADYQSAWAAGQGLAVEQALQSARLPSA